MKTLIHQLYYYSEELDENKYLYESECQAANQSMSKLLDKVEEAAGTSFHETLYDAIWKYLTAEQIRAFHMGLRLGLQLHSL